MRVQVTKDFHWAPDGNNVRLVAVGEVLEGRGAEFALELKSGRVVGARLPMLEEYVAAGYKAENYEAMIADETRRAKAEGLEVEIRLPTLAESGLEREDFEKRLVLIERARQQLEADKAAEAKAQAELAARAAAERLAHEEAEKLKAQALPAEPEPAPTPPAPAPTPAAAPKARSSSNPRR